MSVRSLRTMLPGVSGDGEGTLGLVDKQDGSVVTDLGCV